MRTLMGLINLANDHDYLEEITYFRNPASVPFAGRYRIIDFPLSNMVNSGCNEVAIFTNSKYRSLLDHLGNGDHLGLDDRNSRLFVLPPDWHDPTDISLGDLRHFHNNRDYFNRSVATDVIFGDSHMIANIDYGKAFEYHVDSGNDVTLIGQHTDDYHEMHQPVMRISQEGDQVTWLNHDQHNFHLYTGVYIMRKDKVLDTIDYCIQNYKDNFFHHGVLERLNDLKVGCFDIDEETIYINSLKTFYHANLSILNPDRFKRLFMKENRIKTKISNQPPSKYTKHSNVCNALVANGTVISGTVENSMIYRGVVIEEGAVVKNSIIMTDCHIGNDVYLENVILDKAVTVSNHARLMGSSDKPFVVAKRQTV